MAQPAHEINELPDTFWAWFAGFIDGDGCIGLYGERHYKRPRVSASQKERHILDIVVERMGSGKVVAYRLHTGARHHTLAFGNAASKTICEKILPYLVTKQKRERALLCVAWRPIELDKRANASVKNPLYPKALAMYREGMGMPTIAKALGVTEVCILKWLRRAGIPRRTLSEAQKLAHARRAQKKP